ncbi:hypothetical protein DVH24_042155 [Malus domestica]|uniref:Uncharacterized protein n=1 Tax=Malus domestica TaxID=3750 RepID=A0A498J162_MALDO|nr:hypothetical protein DVH24_042155 [Malus domestica]
MSSRLTEDHKRANYRMLCADSLLYLRDYQAIQSSMECLNWWAIPSKNFGVLPNNNCPSVSNLEVFLFTMVSLSLPIVHSWVCNLVEHLFISTNSDLIVFSATSCIDHPLRVTDLQNLNAHIRSCLFMTTITATWVPAAQNACLTRKHLIRLLDTKRVRQSLLLHDARQSCALPFLSSIVSENQLDRHCDSFGELDCNSFLYNGVLVIMVKLQQSIAELFFHVTLGLFLFQIATCMVHTCTILLPLEIVGTTLPKLRFEMFLAHSLNNWLLSFLNCSMLLSQFERLEDKPHVKGDGLMRLSYWALVMTS